MNGILKRLLWGAAVLLGALSPLPAHAQFYKGKTVTMLVGYDTGGGNDIRARIIVRYLQKYLPGNPNVIVQNMPGASGIRESNYVYNIAKPDGLTIADISRESAIIQASGSAGPQFSFPNFEWIGGLSHEPTLVFIRASTGFNSVADLLKSPRPVVIGSRDTGAINYLGGRALELLGVPLKHVFGYSTPDLTLAFERGEIDGSSLTLSAFGSRIGWTKPGGLARLVLSIGTTHQDQVPFGLDFKTKDPADQPLYNFINLALGLPNTSYAAPPKTPAERLTELRQAFKSMAEDPEFLQDAAKIGLPVSYLTGEELRAAYVQFESSPSEAKDAFAKLSK